MAWANGLRGPVTLGGIPMAWIRPGSAVRAGGVAGEVKPMIQRRGMQRLREISIGPAGGRFAVALPVAKSCVPFADEARAIAGIT